jgi:hypothetical protein
VCVCVCVADCVGFVWGSPDVGRKRRSSVVMQVQEGQRMSKNENTSKRGNKE